MRVTLLGVLGCVAVAALVGFVLYEWQKGSQEKNEPPQPNPNLNPNLPPENL